MADKIYSKPIKELKTKRSSASPKLPTRGMQDGVNLRLYDVESGKFISEEDRKPGRTYIYKEAN